MGKYLSKAIFQAPPSRSPPDPNCFWLSTKNGTRIPLFFINNHAKFTIIFSHGNAEDIHLVHSWLKNYFLQIVNCNAILYEYSGYGENFNYQPTEKGTYNDISAVYQFATKTLGIRPQTIILYGRSVGSGPTCYLAEKEKDIGGVILHSALTSIFRIVFNWRFTLPWDPFPNISRIKKVKVPVLVIHGTKDEVVPFDHGVQLWMATNRKVEPFFVHGAGHNDVEKVAINLRQRVSKFLEELSLLQLEEE